MRRKHLTVTALSLLFLALTLPAFAAKTLSGKLNGHHCAHEGMTCPVDKLDPHINLEDDFVLMVKDGYYFLPNLPRDTKVRHVLEDVTVKGDVNEKYRTIAVEELMVGGKTVWSRAWVERERQRLYHDGSSFPGRGF